VRDEARPLERMPAEKPPPEGELPFGPHNLSMYRLNFGSKVVLDGSHLGYRFAAKDAGTRILRLGWKVKAALRRVGRNGQPLGAVGTLSRRLGEVEDLDLLQFSFPAKPGLYRFDISFASLRGRKLGFYREYFRVVPRRVKLRLAVSNPAPLPGATIYARVLNLGTQSVLLHPGMSVERAEGGQWKRQAQLPATERSEREFRWTLYGGEASPCLAFQVPSDTASGAFRFKSSALVFGERHRRTLTAPFRVAPASG
jgi:hypothetical protein